MTPSGILTGAGVQCQLPLGSSLAQVLSMLLQFALRHICGGHSLGRMSLLLGDRIRPLIFPQLPKEFLLAVTHAEQLKKMHATVFLKSIYYYL